MSQETRLVCFSKTIRRDNCVESVTVLVLERRVVGRIRPLSQPPKQIVDVQAEAVEQ